MDALARDLGELYQDTRLLVSELLTAAVSWLGDVGAPQVEISIGRDSVSVELRYDDARAVAAEVEEPGLGEWTRMLLDALTTSWGTSDQSGVCLWFEIKRV